jgi:GT2 family glycosyltransferase
LIALRDHGVSVAFVDRLKSHGYNNLSVRDLIRLHDSGL